MMFKIFRRTKDRKYFADFNMAAPGSVRLGRDPPINYHPLTCPVAANSNPEPTMRGHALSTSDDAPQNSLQTVQQNLPYVGQPTALDPALGVILHATATP
ncbi:hypothetical protein THAOC_23350 [Thalassiosira oceanica]|uniref:Uncharacterized protein n=1 Tax=Thalassiosira oceanica TaxID=159749 RepID=K0RSG1_THAOC|nr:hypothetical protein THAOC_23350 [Thalassiosira oceanica]|eukprot:EJK56713.1 hypothetical protein THAOC_23350 [Thalassiosira oceanica]